jgi:aryl-alcohol dehydrogenase-like predicted oxidoreductase
MTFTYRKRKGATMMQTRALGNTGLRVSAIGLGTAMLGSSDTDYAVSVVRRAYELGVTYYDAARVYRDAEVKLGIALEDVRDRVILSTKVTARTRDDAWRQLEETFRDLRTDYVDNCHLHGVRAGEDLAQRCGPGGPLEALIEAREQGVVRHIGATGHSSASLIEALERWPFEVILVPMNLVEPEPLDQLIPLCQQRGVGVTIMKPVGTGLIPAPIALKWLLNQPIASCVPGATTLEEVEENCLVGHADATLTPADVARVAELRQELAHVRCRLCDACLPCPAEIGLPGVLGTDVMYDHYRTMGPEGFRAFTWSRNAIKWDLPTREKTIAAIQACDHCGECEARCPHGLPIQSMIAGMVPAMEDMVSVYRQFLS